MINNHNINIFMYGKYFIILTSEGWSVEGMVRAGAGTHTLFSFLVNDQSGPLAEVWDMPQQSTVHNSFLYSIVWNQEKSSLSCKYFFSKLVRQRWNSNKVTFSTQRLYPISDFYLEIIIFCKKITVKMLMY